MDLLIFTDWSANEEWSDVGVGFMIKKIKNGQIWKLRSDDNSRKYMLFFSSRFDSNKIRSRMTITTEDQMEDC